jgi:uncharacterized protein (TIGR03000 family)
MLQTRSIRLAAVLAVFFLTVGLAAAQQFGPGQSGPNWDRGQGYSSGGYYSTPAVPFTPFTNAAPVTSQSFFNAPMQNNRIAVIRMRVPANARVSFDDTQTTQTGTDRQYVSPPLDTGNSYAYQVRVQWDEGGKPVEQVRRVPVRAGDQINLDFTNANAAGTNESSQAR